VSSSFSAETSSETGDHLIGRYGGHPGGPLLLCVGGLHGNEPAGVLALRRVLATLAETRPPFRGQIVGLAGNLTALSRRIRFVHEDLNRVWTLERVADLRGARTNGGDPGATDDPRTAGGRDRTGSSREGTIRSTAAPSGDGGAPPTVEADEQGRLLRAVEAVLRDAGDSPVYFLDLHTTSSESVPFLTFSDSLRNRSFAGNFPIPLVLGVEEEVDGTLMDFVDYLGHVAVGIEGGNHDNPESVDHLEAVLWLALVSVGSVELSRVPQADGLRRRLSQAVERVPTVFEVRYRHGLREGDEFRMEPNFRNFQEVEEGELLARDRRGEVRAPMSGRVFLPLYQRKGDEGFFIVQEVAPAWLKVSALLRHLKLDRALRFLPGVEPHPEREETLVVTPLLAADLTVQIFHLLGYRRERPEDGRLVLSRRKEAVEDGGG